MPTLTFQVSSSGATSQWTLEAGLDVVSAVNQPDDDATSNIRSSTTSSQRQIYNVAVSGIPSGSTINSVTVFGRCRNGDAGGSRPFVYGRGTSGGGYTAGSGGNGGASYADTSAVFTARNGTAAWTYTDMSTLQIGIENQTFGEVRCTTLYCVIDYTAPLPSNKGGMFFGAA